MCEGNPSGPPPAGHNSFKDLYVATRASLRAWKTDPLRKWAWDEFDALKKGYVLLTFLVASSIYFGCNYGERLSKEKLSEKDGAINTLDKQHADDSRDIVKVRIDAYETNRQKDHEISDLKAEIISLKQRFAVLDQEQIEHIITNKEILHYLSASILSMGQDHEGRQTIGVVRFVFDISNGERFQPLKVNVTVTPENGDLEIAPEEEGFAQELAKYVSANKYYELKFSNSNTKTIGICVRNRWGPSLQTITFSGRNFEKDVTLKLIAKTNDLTKSSFEVIHN